MNKIQYKAKRRKSLFIPPGLLTTHLDTLFSGFRGSRNLTQSTCLLYTLLSADLVRLHLRGEPDGFTQVHSGRLEILFGERYRQIVDLLLSQELLEVNCLNPDTGQHHPAGYYSKTAKHSRAYRVPHHLRAERLFKRIALPATGNVLANKLARLNQATTDPALQAEPFRALVLSNMSELVLPDTAATRDTIRSIFHHQGVSYSTSLGDALIDAFNHSPVSSPTICAFGQRVHTRVTNLHKQLRSQLRFAHDPDAELVEIDLVASQPWFLSVVSPQLIRKFVPECRAAIPLFQQAARSADVVRFREKCADPCPDAGIYGYLRDAYNHRYGENFTRQDAKAICYRAFFSDYTRKEKTSVAKCTRSVLRWERRLARALACQGAGQPGPGPHGSTLSDSATEAAAKLKKARAKLFTQKSYELFRDLFPGLHTLFAALKQLPWDFERGQRQGKKTKYYANNALLAQRLASAIVYGVVIKALVAANITDVLTIHDAFVVRKQDEAGARKVIRKAFSSLRLKPNLK